MVTGVAFSAGESAKHQATLSFEESCAVLRFDGRKVECAVEMLSWSEPIGKLPLQVSFPEGELFIPEHEAALRKHLSSQRGAWLRVMERSKAAILASVFGALLFVAVFIHVGLPAITGGVVALLPNEVPELIGENVMEYLDSELLTPSALSDARKAKIQQRFDFWVGQLPPSERKPKLVFRNWDQGPNAFALSDGTVIVLDPLVKLAETDAQLESVMLHELGHVYHEHVMHAIVRAALISVSIAVVTGESSGVIDLMVGLGIATASAGYSRQNEEEADRFAAMQLTDVFGNALAQAEMFNLMQGNGTSMMPKWLHSHPDAKSRIEAAKQFKRE